MQIADSDVGARRTVVSASGDGTVKLWDTATGRCEQTLAYHTGAVMAVQYDGAEGIIVGASSETYLLERSRVVEIGAGERNHPICSTRCPCPLLTP